MSLETYWLITPLALIGLSGFGWLALWLTRDRKKVRPEPERQGSLHLTAPGT